jgi:uncharacterized MAPEG superfamily protein
MPLPPAYVPLIFALGVMAALFLAQLLVVDVASIRARHVPGTPVPADHNVFLFRAVRAHANTNENVAAFILLAIFGLFSSASPAWLNAMAWLYVAARAAHMICYYVDLRLWRSVAFAISFAALWAMLVVDLIPWF